MHILYCHDTEPDAWLLRALREAGHAVTLACGVAEAATILPADPAEVIIADRPVDPADMARRLAILAPGATRIFLSVGEAPAAPLPGEGVICLGRPLALTALMAHLHVAEGGRGVAPAGVELLPARRAIRAGERVLELGVREYQLLDCLMQQPGATVSVGQLCQRLWNDPSQVHADALKLLVHRLRTRLRGAGGPVRLETVRGAGYRLSAAATS
jgi:hypothetical protein